MAKVVMIILGETIRLKFRTFNQQGGGGKKPKIIQKTEKLIIKSI